MFLKVVSGIRSHFPERIVEWCMAATCAWWGWTLAQPGTAWTNPTAWAGMLRIASEDTWGLVSLLAGGFWLVALAINGTFADTVYARHSPTVRGVAALGSAFVWFQVVLSVSASQSAGSGIYPLPLVLSFWCIFSSWRDIGRERNNADDRRA
jgi:hypothetical protein